MKAIGATSLAWLLIAGFAQGEPEKAQFPAPQWVTPDDAHLGQVFKKATGDDVARIEWFDIPFSRAEKAPLENRHAGVLAFGKGKAVSGRVTRVPFATLFLVADDQAHWLPEDPHHWEIQGKPRQALVVAPPRKDISVSKYSDLAKRVYGVPIFVDGAAKDENIAATVDGFWREMIRELKPGRSRAAGSIMDEDGKADWKMVGAIHVEGSEAVVYLGYAMFDDSQPLVVILRKGADGWRAEGRNFISPE
ncbi:MAG: hypothetical protein ACREKL_13240 [Chthoniobacterales bacterium]